jgi:hypothetical protein
VRQNKRRYEDSVIVINFEDLLGCTEAVMRKLAQELGITFNPILLQQTFNGRPTQANSSFPVEEAGIIAARLTGRRTCRKTSGN